MATERRWLKIRDFLTLRPIEVLEFNDYLKNKDSVTSGQSLLLRVAATHSGIITGNRKFYRPDFMRDSVHTWVPTGKPALPVLRGHDEDGEVLGRIREAKYVDETWKWSKDYPQLKDNYFLNQDSSKKVNLYKSIDYITGTLAKDKSYQGLGHIELGIQLTNPEAIEKVLREEYLCVSAGAVTDEAICSVCHTDWASNDKCEHRPGEIVDGKRMFLISGRFRYEELSFVNFGADPFAAVKSKELKDSLEKMFFLGLSVKDQDKAIINGLKITDSLYDSDIKISYEELPMTIDFTVLETNIKDADLTSEKAFQLKDELHGLKPESEEEKSKLRGLKSTLTAKIRRNNWIQDSQVSEVITDEMKAISVISDSEVVKTLEEINSSVFTCNDEVCSWEGFNLTDEDQTFFADEETVYDELVKEIDIALTNGELKDEQVVDKKLNTEGRKKLDGNVFCGPGRSFPVPDKAHFTAALRLLNRAKVSPETKAKIHSCVMNKGKKNGWTSSVDNKDGLVVSNVITSNEPKISDAISTLAGKSKLNENLKGDPATNPVDIKSILDCYDKLDKHHTAAATEDGLQYKIHDLHNAIGEKWGKERWVGYAAETLAKHENIKDAVIISKDDLELKEEAILGLTDEVNKLKELLTLKDKSVAAFFKESKRSLASTIVMHKILRNQDGYVGLTLDQVEEKINTLVTRRIESLKDSLFDIFTELQWNKETNVTVVKNTDSAITVDNNTRVDEAIVLNQEAIVEINPEVELRDRRDMQRLLVYITDPVKKEKYRRALLIDSGRDTK